MSFLWSEPTSLPGRRLGRPAPRPSRRQTLKAAQARCVELRKLGLTMPELGRLFDRSDEAIRQWLRQAEREAAGADDSRV